MAKIKRSSKSESRSSSLTFKNYWDSKNYILLFVGLAILIIGNVLMAQGPWDNPVSLTIAPVVLLIGYLVIVPLSIMYSKKKDYFEEDNNQQ